MARGWNRRRLGRTSALDITGVLAAAMAAVLLALAAAPAHAGKLRFGTDESLHHLQDVAIKGPSGEALYLGYKVSFHFFGLPYGVTDDGYVLAVRGESRYFGIDPERLARWQAGGYLPMPLPAYELSAIDYVAGHLLWITIALFAAWYGGKALHEHVRGPAPAAPAPAQPSHPVEAEAAAGARSSRPSALPRVVAEGLGRATAMVETARGRWEHLIEILRGTPPSPRTMRPSRPEPVAPAASSPLCAQVVQMRAAPAADYAALPVARVVCRVKQSKAA